MVIIKQVKIRNDLSGQKFGKLLVINRVEDRSSPDSRYVRPTYKCLCECGEYTLIPGYYLTNNGTKSCGCTFKKSIINSYITNKNYNPVMSSAKDIYYSLYKDGNLSFDNFLIMSQKNCYYCGAIPSNTYNIAKKPGADFRYNGTDRINSLLPHNYDNVITCCKHCNFAKSDLSLEEFLMWPIRLKNNYNNLILTNEVRLVMAA
jgi:hypothetical protein